MKQRWSHGSFVVIFTPWKYALAPQDKHCHSAGTGKVLVICLTSIAYLLSISVYLNWMQKRMLFHYLYIIKIFKRLIKTWKFNVNILAVMFGEYLRNSSYVSSHKNIMASRIQTFFRPCVAGADWWLRACFILKTDPRMSTFVWSRSAESLIISRCSLPGVGFTWQSLLTFF